MSQRIWPGGFFLVLFLVASISPLLAQAEKPRSKGKGRDPLKFTFLKEEGFPLNVDPKIVPAAEATLGEGDLVMGIVHGGEARAYPVNYMNGPHNEVVNDRLGETAVAPSW